MKRTEIRSNEQAVEQLKQVYFFFKYEVPLENHYYC